MSDQPLVQYASRTDVGMRRSANQDSLAVRLCQDATEWQTCGHLFVVADGMGGHAVGDLASRIAVDTLPMAYAKQDAENIAERLRKAIIDANRAINNKARENPEFNNMGTTCSTLVLSPSGAFVGQVGDSRVYRIRDQTIDQLSFDHSLQWEMIRQGRATSENVDLLHPRNVITRCLGPEPQIEVDLEGPFSVLPGDRFVICSDGLTGHVSDTEIGAIAQTLSPKDATRLLVDLANCRGGTDNITVVIANVERFPTMQGEFVDQQVPKAAQRPPSFIRRNLGNVTLFIFVILGLVGLLLLARDQKWGLLFICPALLLGFARLAFANAAQQTGAAESDADPKNEVHSELMPRPPYRSATAMIEDGFIHFLAEAQHDLSDAAKDNGWNVELEQLSDLDRQATDAFRQKELQKCVRIRATAIDELMKQLYSNTRQL